MKYLKWVTFLILVFFSVLVVLTLHPKTVHHLENNFRNNVIRSFEDSGMPTQLYDVKVSFWPLLIKWPMMNITRKSASKLPNSWLQIFQSVKLSNCTLSINLGWFRFNSELQCKKINVSHLPLRWFHVVSLNSSFSKDFYFLHSDFRNLEDKQGWWKMTLKADKLIKKEKIIRSFHLNYYFSSRTELVIEWPNSKEKMILINEPEQLRVVRPGMKENFGFLSKSLYAEIKSLRQNTL